MSIISFVFHPICNERKPTEYTFLPPVVFFCEKRRHAALKFGEGEEIKALTKPSAG